MRLDVFRSAFLRRAHFGLNLRLSCRIGRATRELTAQLFDDSLGKLGLDGEDILQIAGVIFRPLLFARVGLSESGRDAHDVAGLAHASLDQMRHAEFLPDFLCRRVLTFEGKGRGPRGDVQAGNFCSTVSNSSLMPSEKYSLPLSSLRLANASTATDLALAADLGSADGRAATSAASRRGVRTNLSNTKYPSASSSTAMIMRFMRRAVCGAIDSSGGTSSSRFKPCGVSSKTQLKISAGMKPIASKMTILRGNQSGAPNIGSTVLAT